MKKIVIAVGDMGAWQYFQPVLSKLQELYDVIILADPKGAALGELQKTGVSHTETSGNGGFDLTDVSAVLCGTAGKAFELWRNVTMIAKDMGVPVVWFGDFYASGFETKVADLSPDFMATFDDTTRTRFLEMRPGFNTNRVQALGNPSFDPIATLNVPAMRARTRAALGLKDNETFVLYSGSSFKQFSLEKESLDPLVRWVAGQGGVRFAFRFHPADVKNEPLEVNRLSKRLVDEVGAQLVNTGELKDLELAAGTDLLVTDYSTEGVRPALAGIKTVFLMLPSAQEYMHKNKGGAFPFFSVLEKDEQGRAPALVVATDLEVEAILDRALLPETAAQMQEALKDPRYQALRDGKAGERVIAFIKEIVS